MTVIGPYRLLRTLGGCEAGQVWSAFDADGHPDLAGAVRPGADFDSTGRRAADDHSGQLDRVGHGTRMAGIIAARGGGPNHALGIAPGASIMPVAVSTGSGIIGSLAEPVRFAVDHGAKVINISLARPAGEALPPGEVEAIRAAVTGGVVVVVSIGNSTEMTAASALADLPGVVAVAGTNRAGVISATSLSGRHLGLAASSEQIVTIGERSRFPTGYSSAGGTSEATAIVSGVAALIRARFPDLDGANVVNRLVATAVDLGPAGRDDQSGFGRVDAERALSMDVSTVDSNPLGDPAAPVPPGPLDAPAPDRRPVVFAVVACAVAVLLIVALLVGLVVWLTNRRRRPPVLPRGPAG